MASRRGAEELLRAGRVAVNGRTARLGESADPARDAVTLDGERVRLEPVAYWMLHKPRGVLTTLRDPFGRATVRELLPLRGLRLFPVGRLDRDSEGLLLFTNDGAAAQVLLHPSFGSEREYEVHVRGELGPGVVRSLERGVRLAEGVTAPARVEGVDVDPARGETRLRLVLVEGRKRQIRRSLRALGHPVRKLVRVRMGPVRLGRLPEGEARELRPEERRALQRELERLRERRQGARRGPR